MAYTASFYNLGCKVNAYETEAMEEQFALRGFTVVPFGKPADVTVVNTCTVTKMADHKSRQILHRAKKISPEGLVAAVGCYVQVMTEEQRDAVEGVDVFLGNDEKQRAAGIVEEILEQRKKKASACGGTAPYVEVRPIDRPVPYEDLTLHGLSGHTRGIVKIQDGCNQFCSYCKIPYARGRVRSKAPDDVLNEIDTLCKQGYREIVLTGIHISSYGTDIGTDLTRLMTDLGALLQGSGDIRIRLGSLEAGIISPSFLEAFSKVPGACPHFHLSLQSGCDRTLKAMNRKYTTKEFAEKTAMIRDVWPDAAVTTDIIAGFPGETDEDFEETMAYVRSLDFAQTHIFKYSAREGTRAASFPDQIPEAVKHERSSRLIALGYEKRREYIHRFFARAVPVLIEEIREESGGLSGVGFTPEYIYVYVPLPDAAEHPERYINQMIGVMIIDHHGPDEQEAAGIRCQDFSSCCLA